MMSLVARFLPSLGGAVSGMFNPWIICAMMAALGGAFFYGLHLGEKSKETYIAQQEALSAKQNAENAIKIDTWKKLKEDIDERAKLQDELRLAQLAQSNERLRAATKSRPRLLSSSTGGPNGDIRVCASRDTLDSEISGAINRVIERHATRNLQLAEEGARAVSVATLCRDWTKGLK